MKKNNRGFYPFWFWNAKIEAEEIKYQVKEMADKGIKGFFIHPRQGLEQPYLSKSFFKMVKVAVEAAKKHGLEVELYDEFPYPSGVAGGEVILGNPHYQATYLDEKNYIVENGHCRLELEAGKILSAKAYPIKNNTVDFNYEIDLKKDIGIILNGESYSYDGLTKYNKKRYFGNQPTPVLDRYFSTDYQRYKIFISVQKKIENHKYWYNYVDVFNPEAVDEFIKLTHQRYKDNLAEEFGKNIGSIFADEIAPGWSHILVDKFKEEYNYDLLESLTALQAEEHPKHLEVKKDLYKLKYKLFIKNFDAKIANWCQENNLDYCGEKPSLRLSQLKHMDVPGCEPGHTKAGADLDIFQTSIRGNARSTAAADYFYDKNGSLCECYHSIGWSGNLEDAKIIAESLLLAGINYLVPHGFFYSTHGLRKHDAPPSFFFQMPFWPLFGELSQRIDKINDYFKNTYIDAETVIFEPHSGLPNQSDLKKYKEIMDYLFSKQISFQIVDTDILKEGRIEEQSLRIKELNIKNIIIPPFQIEDDELSAAIQNLEKSGLKIINLNENNDLKQLENLCSQNNQFDLEIESDNDLNGLYYVKRSSKTDSENLYFFVNSKAKKHQFKINTEKNLREITLDEEASNLSDLNFENGHYTRTVYPFESFLLKETQLERKRNLSLPELKLEIDEDYKIQLQNKNLLRIYEWNLSMLSDEGDYKSKASVQSVPISNILEEHKLHYAPNIENYFGSQTKLSFPGFSLLYEYQFKNDYQGKVELLMESDSINGEWKIRINESPLLNKDDFYKTDTHLRGSSALQIDSYLNQGSNTISVYLETKTGNDGIVNPLYLAGDFGVELKEEKLCSLQNRGGFEKYQENKTPYYAGVLKYSRNFELKKEEVKKYKNFEEVIVDLNFPTNFHDAAQIKINNSEYKNLLWEPRRFKLNTSELKEGKNNITIKVYTSLIRSFEGTEFNYNEHKYFDIK